MVVKKINHWMLLGWFFLLISCKTEEKKPEIQYFIHKNAGYVLLSSSGSEWASYPDAWTRKLLSSSDRKLFQSLHPYNGIINFLISPDQSVHFLAVFYHPDTTKKINISKPYFFKQQNRLLFIANDSLLLNDFTSRTNQFLIPKEKALKYYQACNPDALIHWYIFPEHIPGNKFPAFHPGWLFKHSGSAYVWDKEIPSEPLYSGISFPVDTLNDFSLVFHRLEPSSYHPVYYLSQETESFVILKFNSFPVFHKQWKEYKTTAGYRDNSRARYLKSLKSIAFAGASEDYVVGLFSEEPSAWSGQLEKIDRQNQMLIYKNPDSSFLSRLFYPLVSKKSYSYVGIDGSVVIWAQSIEFLKKLSDDIIEDKVLMARKSFKKIREMVGNDNHILTYRKGTLYFAQADDGFFLNGIIQEHGAPKIKSTSTSSKTKSAPSSSSYKTYLVRQINDTFLLKPHWVFNHRSGKYEILYQDRVKRLKLTDALGNERWSKTLEAPVNSDVFQVDMFKNRKRQFVFSTGKALYLTDILGNDVAPFPLEIKIKSPIAVFDYDNNKNYRIAVPSGNKVVLYNVQGKIIKDFKSPRLTEKLQSPPQHIRIGRKDYILLQQVDGTLHIVDRRGNPRIKIKDKIRLKTGKWFKHKNSFVALASQGKIISLSTGGKITYPYPEENQLTQALFSEQNRFTTDGEKVYLNGQKLSLPQGVYTHLQHYSWNGKDHWATYDRSTHTTFIILPGHPLVIKKLPGLQLLDLIKRRNTYYAIVTDTEGRWKVISFKS